LYIKPNRATEETGKSLESVASIDMIHEPTIGFEEKLTGFSY
jgi:hypothetical protein